MRYLMTVVRIYDNHTIENSFFYSYLDAVNAAEGIVEKYVKLFPELDCNVTIEGSRNRYITVWEDKTLDRKIVIKIDGVDV